jgi:hypothetical protein
MPSSFLIAGGLPLIFLAIATLIETLVLFLLKWAPLPGAFRDAVVANLVSTVVLALVSQLVLGLGNIFLVLLAALLIACAVEGLVLMLLRRRTVLASYQAALSANCAAFLFAYAFVFSFLVI